MLTYFYVVGLVTGLGQITMAAPQLQSVTFRAEMEDRLEDITIQGTVYFSMKHQAYRYDFNSGQLKVFIYPKEGKAYYYYPASDFHKNKFNFTVCEYFRTPAWPYLPNPMPSVDGFNYVGPDNVYDTRAEKYTFDDPLSFRNTLMWIEKVDPKTGIHERPIRKVINEWSQYDPKENIQKHRAIEYFEFSVGEQDSSIWDRPQMECLDADAREHTSIIAGTLRDFDIPLTEILPGPLDDASSSGSQWTSIRKYARGRKNILVNDEDDISGLLLPLPYTPQETDQMIKKVPEHFDWRYHGAVTNVKNQRHCGSCWAFGTVGSLEGAYFRKTGSLVSISEQALVDCAGGTDPTSPYTDTTNGCFGGSEQSGYTWVKQAGGIPPTAEYSPYQEANGYCRVTNQTNLIARVIGYYHIPGDIDSIKGFLFLLGPLAVSIDSSNIDQYTNGIIPCNPCDPSKIDHAVLLVGYGVTTENDPYWIIKNSWGNIWGLDGYFLMSATGNCDCILEQAYFPVLDRHHDDEY